MYNLPFSINRIPSFVIKSNFCSAKMKVLIVVAVVCCLLYCQVLAMPADAPALDLADKPSLDIPKPVDLDTAAVAKTKRQTSSSSGAASGPGGSSSSSSSAGAGK